ncbi:hypothetical protein DKX38_016136 [Salix brachista]|uniref:Uncharacterized protein n=1 Tax=Salix brachista TaxID=2182728 RepID=A0A5N5L767_9ROSI|nr:hypothetical protein DKX38_016136 [Salix brachista]
MKGSSRKVPGMPMINRRKDRDEDLLLFKELHRRENDRLASLLQPVSDEFEPNIGGDYALYRIASGRKGSGHELFGENDKNDYDWSTIPSQIPGFSNDTPLNLRTDRATSATRARLAAAIPTAPISQKQDPTPRPRRQSCSPSVKRGRKESNEENLTSSKGKTVTGNNGAQIFGSRMVDKVMNARKFGDEDREAKPSQSATKSANSSANASPGQGFGRMMMTKSQMDMAFKHMVIAKDRINSRHLGITYGRSSGQNELD